MTLRAEQSALLAAALVTLGVLALAEEFAHVPPAIVAFLAAHVVLRRTDPGKGQDQTDATFLR